MRKLLFILSCIILVLTAIGCRPKEDKAYKKAMANKVKITNILRSTGRPGMEDVIRQLESSDFFTRGAGGHHNHVGGLAKHSLEVYRMMRLFAPFQPYDSKVIIGIFHDMGKIDKGGWHPWRSVKLLGEWGLKLTDEEYTVIFKHHRPDLHYFRSPLRRALTMADVLSAGWWKLWHWKKNNVPEEEYNEDDPH
jgi:hypothetical protein